MSDAIDLVLFDVGGVLGTNAWDREQRAASGDEVRPRRRRLPVPPRRNGRRVRVRRSLARRVPRDHRLLRAAGLFGGRVQEIHVRAERRRGRTRSPWRETWLGQEGSRLATLNNESEELNRFRIDSFGLREIFPTFFTSCWLGVRKPTRHIYERVLGMTQADPARTVFIDDRLQNLAPAASLRVQTLHFTSGEKLRSDLRARGLL